MFARKNLTFPPNKISSIIGQGTVFKGTIRGEGCVRIDGEFEGVISNNGDVIIDQNGRVTAELKAQKITIAGKYEGNIEADILEVKKTGIADGKFIISESLIVEEGAILTGNFAMKSDKLSASDIVKPYKVKGGAVDPVALTETEETPEQSMEKTG